MSLFIRSRKKLSNGQTAQLDFHKEFISHGIEYTVALVVTDKKHQLTGAAALESQTTGKCGLEALLWAKQRILEFDADLVRSRACHEYFRMRQEPEIISISWADSRRRRVYMHGLVKHGYKYDPTQKRIFKRFE